MNFRKTLVAATLLALPIAANAQPIDGLYIGGGAGVNFMQQGHVSASTGKTSISKDMSTAAGPAIVVSLGWGFGNGLRAEVEGDFRNNTYSGTGYGGQEQKFGAMANVLYDFVGALPAVTPYVGVGVGYMDVKESNLHAGGFSAATNSEGSFAYQAIVGVALPIAAAPGLSLTADYRFMGLAGDRHYTGTPATMKMDQDYNHSLIFGVRYAFGAAPAPMAAPAAAPVPAAAASRSYIVFFDWDKAVLTDRARQIVSEAAMNSKKVQVTTIEVNGYTDTSGTPQYNQGLSVRRAQAVAAELVKDGVPQSAISIHGFGETHPLVPTGPNVREPQNRRVEIILK
jgi:outer membrane protein OmpA-like peptidoglycan-associated protein